MTRRRFALALRRDRRGATITEFGLIAPVFFLMLLGLFELGYEMYLQSIVEGTVHKAARVASIGTSGTAQVDSYVRQQLAAFATDSIVIDKKSYYQFSGVGKAEKDDDGDGVCESGESYIDENKDGRYNDGRSSGSAGLGSSDDVIFYTVTANYKRLFPMARFLGISEDMSASASTVLRNQPYGAQNALPTKTPCP